MNFDWLRGIGSAADFMSQFLMQKKLLDEEQKRQEEQSGRQKQNQELQILQALLQLMPGGANIPIGESLKGKGFGKEQFMTQLPAQNLPVPTPTGGETTLPSRPQEAPLFTPGQEYYQKPKELTFEQQLAQKAQQIYSEETARGAAKEQFKEPLSEHKLKKEAYEEQSWESKAEINKLTLALKRADLAIKNNKINDANKILKDAKINPTLLSTARQIIDRNAQANVSTVQRWTGYKAPYSENDVIKMYLKLLKTLPNLQNAPKEIQDLLLIDRAQLTPEQKAEIAKYFPDIKD